jgi:hypothetical protein
VGPDQLDLAGASLRAEGRELDAFLEVLAARLEEALPGVAKVERRRFGLRGPRRVRRIALDAGERRLELLVGGGGSPQACRLRLSGGIVLRRERLSLEDWLRELAEVVAERARESSAAREALERILTG